MKRLVGSGVIALLAGGSLWLYAAQLPDPPTELPYAGYLEQDGAPISGNVKLVVEFWDAVSAGASLWKETVGTIPVTAGRFSVTLGKAAAIPQSVFTSGNPVYLAISVNDVVLSGRQRILPVAYAISAANANHSAGDFTVQGGVTMSGAVAVGGAASVGGGMTVGGPITLTGNRAMRFQINSGDNPATGIEYRPTGAPDAVAISGAGPNAGKRLLRLYDDVSVNGDIRANRLLPDYDSGWFYVTNASGDIGGGVGTNPLNHGLGKLPSHFELLQCGDVLHFTGNVPVDKFGDCLTRVVMAHGYHDGGTQVNPLTIIVNSFNFLIPILSDWWVWNYWTNAKGWNCLAGYNCFTAYYRVLAWR